MLQRDEGRRLFGLDPAGYEAGRPEYPTYVYDVLVTRCGLRPGCRVLEIGPGTGLVTRHLLMDGARVTAVEPDLMLAEYLMAACPHVGVVGAPFEDALIPEATYDLAVAATSFHWVEQELGLAKLGRALKTGGWVALWWTVSRDPGHPDSFAEAVEQILGPATRGTFDESGRPPFQLDEEHRKRDLAAWAGLVDVQSELFHWPCLLSPAQARALYASMATVLRRPLDEQVRLLDAIEHLAADQFGGMVERRFVTALYTGCRS